MSEEKAKANLKQQLTQLQAFMATEAYSSRQTTLQIDIKGVKDAILSMPPITEVDRSNVLILHGRLVELENEFAFFKDSCVGLEAELLQAEELEPDNTKT